MAADLEFLEAKKKAEQAIIDCDMAGHGLAQEASRYTDAKAALKQAEAKAFLSITTKMSVAEKERMVVGMVAAEQEALDSAYFEKNYADVEYSTAKAQRHLALLEVEYWAKNGNVD